MKALFKKIIHTNPMVYKFAESIYNFRFWHPKQWKNNILHDYAEYKSDVKFIQVGSNNGVSADPIHELIVQNNWKGILVEPVKYLFDELKKNYRSIQNRLIFENCAIASSNGDLNFYRLQKSDSPDLPYWYDQLGSFNKDVVLKHKESIPNFDQLLIEETVSAITFKDLLKKHSIRKIDFIQIDTEGYDFEILKMIPFADLDIDFIMFENRHLSDNDYREALKLLKKNDFEVGTMYKDTIAVRKKLVPYITPSTNKSTKVFNSAHKKVHQLVS